MTNYENPTYTGSDEQAKDLLDPTRASVVPVDQTEVDRLTQSNFFLTGQANTLRDNLRTLRQDVTNVLAEALVEHDVPGDVVECWAELLHVELPTKTVEVEVIASYTATGSTTVTVEVEVPIGTPTDDAYVMKDYLDDQENLIDEAVNEHIANEGVGYDDDVEVTDYEVR